MKPEQIVPIDELSMGTDFQSKKILKTENFDKNFSQTFVQPNMNNLDIQEHINKDVEMISTISAVNSLNYRSQQ